MEGVPSSISAENLVMTEFGLNRHEECVGIASFFLVFGFGLLTSVEKLAQFKISHFRESSSSGAEEDSVYN
jgi:hypothetical protein